MTNILPILQITISVILVIVILLQNRSAGIGALGGSESSETSFGSRRGFEKILFNFTIALAIAFGVVSILSFILS